MVGDFDRQLPAAAAAWYAPGAPRPLTVITLVSGDSFLIRSIAVAPLMSCLSVVASAGSCGIFQPYCREGVEYPSLGAISIA